MTIDELRALGERATKVGAAPIHMTAGGNWWPIHTAECRRLHDLGHGCSCSVAERVNARDRFMRDAPAHWDALLAIAEAAEALRDKRATVLDDPSGGGMVDAHLATLALFAALDALTPKEDDK